VHGPPPPPQFLDSPFSGAFVWKLERDFPFFFVRSAPTPFPFPRNPLRPWSELISVSEAQCVFMNVKRIYPVTSSFSFFYDFPLCCFLVEVYDLSPLSRWVISFFLPEDPGCFGASPPSAPLTVVRVFLVISSLTLMFPLGRSSDPYLLPSISRCQFTLGDAGPNHLPRCSFLFAPAFSLAIRSPTPRRFHLPLEDPFFFSGLSTQGPRHFYVFPPFPVSERSRSA